MAALRSAGRGGNIILYIERTNLSVSLSQVLEPLMSVLDLVAKGFSYSIARLANLPGIEGNDIVPLVTVAVHPDYGDRITVTVHQLMPVPRASSPRPLLEFSYCVAIR